MGLVKPEIEMGNSLGGKVYWESSKKKKGKKPIITEDPSEWRIETILIDIDSNYIPPPPKKK